MPKLKLITIAFILTALSYSVYSFKRNTQDNKATAFNISTKLQVPPCFPKNLNITDTHRVTHKGVTYYSLIATQKASREFPKGITASSSFLAQKQLLFFTFSPTNRKCKEIELYGLYKLQEKVPLSVAIELKKHYWKNQIEEAGNIKKLENLLKPDKNQKRDSNIFIFPEDFQALKSLGVKFPESKVEKRATIEIRKSFELQR